MTFDDINRDKIAGAQPICAHAVALCRRVFLSKARQAAAAQCTKLFPYVPFFIFFSPLFTHPWMWPSCLGISAKVRHLFQAVVIPCVNNGRYTIKVSCNRVRGG